MMDFTSEFTEQSAFRMEESAERIAKCLLYYTDETVWQKPGPESNSMGNLVLHLCGNITQYILSSLGGQPDNRHRDAEFAAEGDYTCAVLAQMIAGVIAEACHIIRQLPADELLRVRPVQCYEMSGLAIIIHVTEHLSYHTGQIAYYTKWAHHTQLDFYAGQDLGKTV